MKQQFLKLSLLLLTLLLGVPLEMMADRDVNQLQFGKQTIEVASGETITFYDPWGTENVLANNRYNSQSLTVFKPAEAGKSIQITFEKIDLNQYSETYFMYLNIYDGIADADNTFSFAESVSDVKVGSSFAGMSGTLLEEKLTGSQPVNLDFVDFVRVYTGLNQTVGILGETSTEVCGAEDLHLDESIAAITAAGIDGVSETHEATETARYTTGGTRINAPQRGLNIIRMSDGTVRKVLIP